MQWQLPWLFVVVLALVLLLLMVLGWWRSSGRVDVAAAYRNPHVPARVSEGRQGRARCTEQFRHENMTRQLRDLYQKLLA